MKESLSPNTTLSRYLILSQLGAGGMGEVYRAQDERLGRSVAIKLLPSEFSRDEDRLRRFEQEARATSALNHPNILTVYDIGTHEGAPYIVAELLEGEELREQLNDGALPLRKAIEYAQQVAQGLSAAHEKGIVHRDLKPENLFVTKDGRVKILDFGLAKLKPPKLVGGVDSDAPTKLPLTVPGVVMGTVGYMSPEQVRGLEVDARTDIFSLGVVLYEMVAGHAPFGGATAADVFVSILEKEPAPLSRHAPETPAELERIVSKALAKDREERYQTVKDLLIDLKRLKQRLEYEQYREREGAEVQSERAASVAPDGAAVERSSQPEVVETAQAAAASTGEAGAIRTTSSAEYLISEIKRHKRGAALVLASLVVIITGVAFGLDQWIGHNQSRSSVPFQELKLTSLTTNGKAIVAAISPDGKYVAYVMDEERQQSLWLRQMAIGSTGPIVPSAEVRYQDLTFSRDGNFLYYVVMDRNRELSGLYQMTYLGRNPRRLMAGRITNFTLSPDGNRLGFVRSNLQARGETTLIVANADGSNEQTLATRQMPDVFAGPLAWSPDGKIITCVTRRSSDDLLYTLVVVSVEGGAEKPLTGHRWETIGSVTWLADGSGVIISAIDQALGPSSQLWQLSYPGGEERKLTNDLHNYQGSSLTADSSALVTLQEGTSVSLWIAPKGEASRATELTARTGKDDGQLGVAWTPDGKIVYTSNASGSADLWMMNADGSNQKQLTMNAGRNTWPAVSPDGRYLVFMSNRAGSSGVWRMNLDGSNPKQLTSNGTAPQYSPDGNWVIYFYSLPPALWKAPTGGGTPVQLADPPSSYPAIAPDGKLIAYFTVHGQKIAVMPFEGGPPIKTFDSTPGVVPLYPGLRWTPDGRALTCVNTLGGVSNIWSQPIDGGPPRQLTDFKAEQIFAFDWSRDGRLLLARGLANRDVVLISGFK